MTMPHRTAFVTGVLLVSVVVGALALGGPAAALEPDRSSPYPDTVGSSSKTPVAIFVNESDAITEEGLSTLTFDYGADGNFDGSVANVTGGDVSVLVSREKAGGGRTVAARLDAIEVATESDGERLVAQFDRPIDVQGGDRIVALIENFSTPTEAGQYSVRVTATTPSGAEDGPVSVGYAADRATMEFENQTASQFGPQEVSVSGVVPSYGYVAVFRSENGTPGEFLGSTEVDPPSFDVQNYTIALDGAVTESQKLIAVPYYESTGDTLSTRRSEQFDPESDEAFHNNGVMANDTGFVSVVDADGRVAAGSSYDQGARLFFDRGEAGTAYAVRTVSDGEPGETVEKFETAENGTAIIDTAEFETGQYTIVRLSDSSVLSLDDDDTTGAADDSFQITPPSATTAATSETNTTSVNASADENTSTDENASAGGGENESATDATGDTTTATTSTDAETTSDETGDSSGNGGDGGDGGSNLPGPGFGVGVALAAVLAVALLAARRE